MIIISISGLDPYVTAHYSKDHTANLANLFEVEETEIAFEATSNVMVYKGVEQVSWNALVRVYAPHKYEVLEKMVAQYLSQTLKDFSIHVIVEFHYIHDHSQHLSFNDSYPRYIDEKHIDVTHEEFEEDEDEDAGYNENIYDGNIFEGFEEKLDEVYDRLEKEVKK